MLLFIALQTCFGFSLLTVFISNTYAHFRSAEEYETLLVCPWAQDSELKNCRFGFSYSFHFQDIPLGDCQSFLACSDALSKLALCAYSQLF